MCARHVRLLWRPGRWCGRTHTTTTRTWLGSTRPPARAQCCSSTTGWTAPAPKRRRASAGLPQHRHRHSCHVCHPRGAKCVLSLEPPVRVLLAWPGPQHTHCNISLLRCTIIMHTLHVPVVPRTTVPSALAAAHTERLVFPEWQIHPSVVLAEPCPCCSMHPIRQATVRAVCCCCIRHPRPCGAMEL